jgi:hypothetical protein
VSVWSKYISNGVEGMNSKFEQSSFINIMALSLNPSADVFSSS